MAKEKKVKEKIVLDPFTEWAHKSGRIFMVLFIAYMVVIPLIVCTVYDCMPSFKMCLPGLIAILAIMGPMSIAEVGSYTPILGSSTYLTFVTGNVMNLKVPCIINAQQVAKVEPNTVEGDAIVKPQNVEVPIGTLYRDVIEACGGIKPDVELGKIIFGGPMMGGAAPSADFPVLKQNNGLLLFSKKTADLPEASACIRCGRCIDACPMGLEPVVVAEAFNNKDFDTLKARCVDLCVACGSCSYACPAKRPVSQTMTLAKAWYMGELRKGGK